MNKIYWLILRLCIFLTTSNYAYAQSWTKPMFRDWQQESGVVGLLYNAIQWHNTKLSGYEQDLHTSAVLLALNQAENGEIVEWRSNRSDSSGKVRINVTYNNCRRFEHYILAGGRENSWPETACLNTNTNQWVFSDK